MNNENISIKDVMGSIVPITRFNKGEASKIFDEVNERGMKVVLKNNTPACVLLNPDKYESMIEALEDYALYFEAEKRMKNAEINGFIPEKDIMTELGITEDDLNDIDVEIE
jgi:Phd_YefM.